MPSVNRKRAWEGGPDSGRPNKKTSIGASTSASSSDPDTLVSPCDGHRRYDEWKGMMYGFPKVISGSGAMYPTNYKIDFCTPNPWMCPLVDCRKSFQQPAQLGAHFARSHRKLLLYDEVRSGLFWVIGERRNPDKDGRFRSIVVKRGYYGPDDVRKPPEAWESYVNPTAVKDINPPNLPRPAAAPAAPTAAPPSTTSATASAFASRPLAAPVVATPRSRAANTAAVRPFQPLTALPAAPPAIRRTTPCARPAGRPIRNPSYKVIDISSDGEDVKPSLAELRRGSHSVTLASQRVEAKKDARKSGDNEAHIQNDPFQDNPYQVNDPIEPVHDRHGSAQAPVQRQRQLPAGTWSSVSEQAPQSQSLDIWTYITQFSRTPAPRPDDEAIAELLKLPRRRDIPTGWRRRLGVFNTLSLQQLTAFIWYLGGDASLTSRCAPRSMNCNLRPSAVNCADPSHKDGQCPSCRLPFPECVYLPRHLVSSPAISKRVEIYSCCNAYYRSMGFQQNKGAVRLSYVDEITAIKSNATEKGMRESSIPRSKPSSVPPTGELARARSQTSAPRSTQSITHSQPPKPVFVSNLAIYNEPRATHQQGPKQTSASSHGSPGTFWIPENARGQRFSLKGTEIKLIQSSRNQILKCKVLEGDGVKVQLSGGKSFRAYKGWNGEWDISPDSQCLVENVCPEKSFGKDQTVISVTPKKGW